MALAAAATGTTAAPISASGGGGGDVGAATGGGANAVDLPGVAFGPLMPQSQRVTAVVAALAAARHIGQLNDTFVQLLETGREGTWWRDDSCVCDGGVCLGVSDVLCSAGVGVAFDFCQCAWTSAGPIVGAADFWRGEGSDDLGGVRRLLTDPFAPDGIAIGDASHSWGRAYQGAGSGQVVLHVDLRPAPAGSPFLHYQGDACDVAFTRRWRWLKAHPSCDDIGLKTLEGSPGKRSLRNKTSDGRAWTGCKFCLLWWCVPVVESAMVEQPESMWHLVYPEIKESLQSVEFKDHGVYLSKVWRLATRGLPTFKPTKVLQ